MDTTIAEPTQPIESMTRDELLAEWNRVQDRRGELADAVADIERQIGWAKSKVWTSGEYSDPLWFRRASTALSHKQTALRHLNRRMQSVEHRRGQLAREEMKERDQQIERRFIAAAKMLLDAETYRAIWNLARTGGTDGQT